MFVNSPSLRLSILCLAFLVAGCASTEQHRLIAQTIAPASQSEISALHRIFLATSREPASEPGVIFSGQRAPEIAFGLVDVSVPEVHESGKLERSPTTHVADPARYFAARRLGLYRDAETFRTVIGRSARERDGRALVFVHGFNTSFDEAVYRMTQIVHDSGYGGVPVLFTWPSSARVLNYIYDQNSATAARDALEKTLHLIAGSGVKRIDIVAHSMGAWLTMEVLRQLAISGDRDLGGRLADVVLASPDIDLDVFQSQMRRYGVPDRNFFVLTSRDDRALNVSRIIAGNAPRLGSGIQPEEVAELGVTVLDVTSLSSPDGLNHTKFAENPVLVRLLGEGLVDSDDTPVTEDRIAQRLEGLTRGIGQTIGSAADLIITTPFEVINIAVGQ
ncbi:alpha/beta hydrolase [Chelativorans sp. M5D2P16]|uniref:alpha/beta hydrolase n=1 Tax=Chelativorans sp. M5D2P16 TaxID=3095678 RepID=UPI002ACA2B3C|nr:alpha/beta hydrolase [Chelativorans sp. M5D2P16]MDZ5696340.1 alpha/beta hydrolase [Chelativorans sp. M5D2P16]